ncbi:MAG: endonuclease/exonuclease/phosphatase family protein [Gemmatimonadetes bacterium]|nr:endonuclease/exonuclease/phosphatase family protein [Gemmatimonadota bacterium]
MLTVRCRCGETYHAEEAHVGRKLRCRRCGRTLVVRPATVPVGLRLRGRARAWADALRRRRATHAAGATGSTGRARPGTPGAGARPAGPAAGALARRLAAAVAWTQRGRAGALRRWTGIASLVYLAGAIAAAALLWGLGDAWWPATILLFSGRWVLLLPLALLVPAALVLLNGRALLALAATAALVLFPIMGLRVHPGRSEADVEDVPGRVRIVTLNAADSRSVGYELPALLEIWRPDIVALQECGRNVAPAVAAARGWHWQVAGRGLCLLSRYPIERVDLMNRSALEDVRATSSIGGAGYVVRYTLRLPGGVVRLTNLHLETPRKGFEAAMRGSLRGLSGNTQLRRIESRLARRWAEGAGGPILVAGDFNTPVESRIFRESWGDLTNAFSSAGNGFGYTRYNGWIRVRIDHVLAGRGWGVLRAVVGDDVGSDHRPLIVDVAPEP